jgi:DNA polymerase-3 subunit alpha (Gram-positive type)
MSEAHNVFIHNKLVGGHYHRFYDSKLETQGIQPLFYNRTTKEMLEEFSFIGDKQLLEDIVINNTYKFANECENIDILLKGLYTPKIEGVNEKLRHLVYQTLGEIYGKNVNKLITNRIEKELNIIIGKGYSVIYWISYLLVKKSIEDGYVVGSRGSVGSSFVAYLSKISEVNCLPAHHICDKCKYHEFYENTSIDGFDLEEKICPICGAKMRSDGHNIPFESFLGTEGAPKVPDIDLNFSGEYQPIAHNFIHDMFGHIRAFRAGTVMTLAESKAYGLVKKYFEMTKPTEIPNNAEIYYLQRYLVDCKSNDGIHAGGMIVIPDENVIEDFCPSQLPPKGDEEA